MNDEPRRYVITDPLDDLVVASACQDESKSASAAPSAAQQPAPSARLAGRTPAAAAPASSLSLSLSCLSHSHFSLALPLSLSVSLSLFLSLARPPLSISFLAAVSLLSSRVVSASLFGGAIREDLPLLTRAFVSCHLLLSSHAVQVAILHSSHAFDASYMFMCVCA